MENILKSYFTGELQDAVCVYISFEEQMLPENHMFY